VKSDRSVVVNAIAAVKHAVDAKFVFQQHSALEHGVHNSCCIAAVHNSKVLTSSLLSYGPSSQELNSNDSNYKITRQLKRGYL